VRVRAGELGPLGSDARLEDNATNNASNTVALLLTAAILTPFVAVLVWERRRYRRASVKILIRLGSQSRWQTRPTLVKTEDDLSFARTIAESIESAGLGHVKVCTFLRRPTMDLVVELASAEVTTSAVQKVVGQRGRVEVVRNGFLPLRYR
jgi:predicted LPLAT superfamily acyltransferase